MGEVYEVTRDPADRTTGNARRVTYLIDPEGVIRAAWEVDDIGMYPAEVLAELRAILGIKV